ncbi:MAG: hypothetical protein R2799_08435 [Crocinitomicaceae bacterium]
MNGWNQLQIKRDTSGRLDTNLVFVKKIESPIAILESDYLGNFYLINKDMITKLSPKLDTLFEQSFKIAGDLTSMDVGQSLKILLYSRDQNLIAYLDNTLTVSETQTSLADRGLYMVELVALSMLNNSLWVYNAENFALEKYNQNFERIFKSDNLSLLLYQEMRPTALLESEDQLYLNNPEHGVLVFDIYGTFLKTLPIKGVNEIHVLDKKVYYIQNDVIHYYDEKTLNTDKFKLPVSGIIYFCISSEYLVLYDGKFVHFYKY